MWLSGCLVGWLLGGLVEQRLADTNVASKPGDDGVPSEFGFRWGSVGWGQLQDTTVASKPVCAGSHQDFVKCSGQYVVGALDDTTVASNSGGDGYHAVLALGLCQSLGATVG